MAWSKIGVAAAAFLCATSVQGAAFASDPAAPASLHAATAADLSAAKAKKKKPAKKKSGAASGGQSSGGATGTPDRGANSY